LSGREQLAELYDINVLSTQRVNRAAVVATNPTITASRGERHLFGIRTRLILAKPLSPGKHD
jgi:hypothetical protein